VMGALAWSAHYAVAKDSRSSIAEGDRES
jgi:hypothetical protein